MSEEDVSTDGQARRRREEGCRREEAIRGLLKRHGDKRLTIVDVEAVAWELGVSRSTMYRLIIAYRAKGTVSSVEPRAMGRRKDAFVLDAKRERLIASAIHEIYLKPERPTMTYLIEQVRARCAQKDLAASRPPDDQGARRSHRSAHGRCEAQRREGRQSHKGRAGAICGVPAARGRTDRPHRGRCLPCR